MRPPSGFVELADGWNSSASEAEQAALRAPSAPSTPTKPHLTVGGLVAAIPRVAWPTLAGLVFGLACLVAGASAPESSLLRVMVMECWSGWAWLFVIFFPVWAFHLCVVAVAALRATVRLACPRARAGAPGDAGRSLLATTLGWLPVGDCAVLGVAWLLLATSSWWAWGSRQLPEAALAREVALSELVFPPDFLWGAATAAYQVEGGLNNTQWYRFEQNFTRDDGSAAIADGWQCGASADAWNRFDDDLALMRALGLRSYRFSVEWSRVEPVRGVYDEKALARYASWAAKLRQAGIEPLVTLHHFTEPLWATDLGGLENVTLADDFGRYAARVGAALGRHVDYWMTVNEIMVVAMLGWVSGEFPPGKKGDTLGMLRAIHTMVEMHRAAHRALHAADVWAAAGGPGAACLVSVAQNVVLWDPASPELPLGALISGFLEGFYNRFVLEQLLRARPVAGGPLGPRGSGLEFMGLNHYFSMLVTASGFYTDFPRRFARSDLGWPLDPGSLFAAVAQYHKWAPALPIMITEHGCDDRRAPDLRRQAFLAQSLLGLRAALVERGIPLLGYQHWSLLDNFEWAKGYSPRFGLFAVDYRSPKRERSWTDGGRLYKEIIAANVAANAAA